MHVRTASIVALLFFAPPSAVSNLARAGDDSLTAHPIHLSLTNGADIVDRVLGSALYDHLSKHPSWLAVEKRPDIRQGLVGLRFLAGALKTDLPGMLRLALGRRVDLYATPGSADDEGTLVLAIDLADAARAHETFEVLDQTLTLVGAADGKPLAEGPVRSVNGQEFHAECGTTIIIGNDRASVEAAVKSLAQRPAAPREAMAQAAPRLRFELDLALLRKLTDSPPLPEIHENGVGALLFHGLAIAINQATRLSGEFRIENDEIALAAALEHPGLDDPKLEWYLAPSGPVTPQLWPQGTIASLRLDRKLAEFYSHRTDWLSEASENDFVQFDQALSLFFGGRSFGEEILPNFGNGILALVTPQHFESLGKRPSPHLPALTLLTPVAPGKLKDKDLAMFFQNTIAIVNLERAQHGQDSLFVRSEKKHGAMVHSARFELPEPEDGGPAPEPEMRFNMSPALTSAHGQFILGTGEEGVDAALAALKGLEDKKSELAQPGRTQLAIDVQAAANELENNRDTLIANRMLDEGEDHAKATQAIDLFLLGLRTLAHLELGIAAKDGHFGLDGALRFADAPQR